MNISTLPEKPYRLETIGPDGKTQRTPMQSFGNARIGASYSRYNNATTAVIYYHDVAVWGRFWGRKAGTQCDRRYAPVSFPTGNRFKI